MSKPLKNIFLVLFAAAYFAASQVTVLSILSAWYSTAADSAVAMHKGPAKDPGFPSWTPRTHLLVFPHPELSQGVASSPFLYPLERAYRINPAEQAPGCYVAYYYSEFCNKAPPQA
jgi:hypothetical protein